MEIHSRLGFVAEPGNQVLARAKIREIGNLLEVVDQLNEERIARGMRRPDEPMNLFVNEKTTELREPIFIELGMPDLFRRLQAVLHGYRKIRKAVRRIGSRVDLDKRTSNVTSELLGVSIE